MSEKIDAICEGIRKALLQHEEMFVNKDVDVEVDVYFGKKGEGAVLVEREPLRLSMSFIVSDEYASVEGTKRWPGPEDVKPS